MAGALYIHDPNIRSLVESVKDELGYKSLSETVEKGMLRLREDARKIPTIDDRVALMQQRFYQKVKKNNPTWSEEEKKSFFDALSGDI